MRSGRRVVGVGLEHVLDHREAPLALDDPGRAFAALPAHEVAQRPRLLDVLRHVRRERRRHLAVLGQLEREADLLDRFDRPLGLRHQLGLAQPAGRLGRLDEPLRVLGAHVVVDLLLDRLGAELGDRVARVDALRAALVAEVAARAVPDPVLLVVLVQPRDVGLVADVADEAEALGERGRPEELRVGLHRVALRDAAAAHDAERFLVDRVHLLLRDDPLLLRDLVVAGVEPRLHRADLVPERRHVDDQVLEHGHVPHRRDRRHVARPRRSASSAPCRQGWRGRPCASRTSRRSSSGSSCGRRACRRACP